MKQGAGTLTLGGPNSYTGTTLVTGGGTLQITGRSSGTISVQVDASAPPAGLNGEKCYA